MALGVGDFMLLVCRCTARSAGHQMITVPRWFAATYQDVFDKGYGTDGSLYDLAMVS